MRASEALSGWISMRKNQLLARVSLDASSPSLLGEASRRRCTHLFTGTTPSTSYAPVRRSPSALTPLGGEAPGQLAAEARVGETFSPRIMVRGDGSVGRFVSTVPVAQSMFLAPSAHQVVAADHVVHSVRDTVAQELDLSAVWTAFGGDRVQASLEASRPRCAASGRTAGYTTRPRPAGRATRRCGHHRRCHRPPAAS